MAEFSFESIFTPEVIADPYPLYRQLREQQPVMAVPDAKMLALTRYESASARSPTR